VPLKNRELDAVIEGGRGRVDKDPGVRSRPKLLPPGIRSYRRTRDREW